MKFFKRKKHTNPHKPEGPKMVKLYFHSQYYTPYHHHLSCLFIRLQNKTSPTWELLRHSCGKCSTVTELNSLSDLILPVCIWVRCMVGPLSTCESSFEACSLIRETTSLSLETIHHFTVLNSL